MRTRPSHRPIPRARAVAALVVVPALLLGLSGCGAAGDSVAIAAAPEQAVSDALATELTGFLEQAQADAKASGAVAGVWAPWAGSWEKAVGTVGPSSEQPITTDMHLRLGTGGTQAMTCQVVAALAEEGTVDLDADISLYLSTTPGLNGITLRQLCQHTSGLADFATALWPTFLDNPNRQWPTLELVSAAQILRPVSAPGAGWSASETGPLVAGLVLSAKTGRSWSSLYQEYIVDRYGLEATRLPPAAETQLPDPHPGAFAFDVPGPGQPPACDRLLDLTALSPSSLGVAGGAVTTLSDLRRLATGLADSPSSEEAWAAPVALGPPYAPWQNAALGGTSAGVLRGFSGAAPGFLTAAFSDPDSGLTVAVSVNNSSAGTAFIAAVAQGLAAIAVDAGTAAGTSGVPKLEWTGAGSRAAIDDLHVC